MGEFVNLIGRYFDSPVGALVDDYKEKRDKSIFRYQGIHVFTGHQGSGKTASMVKFLLEVIKQHPSALISSNLDLKFLKGVKFALTDKQEDGIKYLSSEQSEKLRRTLLARNLFTVLKRIKSDREFLLYETADELATIMMLVKRGKAGHVIVSDEIHLYLNSVNSRETSIETFASISQLRKNRTLILATSQLAMRLEKAVREQMTTIIACETKFGLLTKQTAISGRTAILDSRSGKLQGNIIAKGFFVQTRELRNSYDTFQIVQPASQIYEQLYQINVESKK